MVERTTVEGRAGYTLTDAGEEPVLEPAPGETPLWSRLRVTALYQATTDPLPILAMLSALPGGPRPDTIAIERLEDRGVLEPAAARGRAASELPRAALDLLQELERLFDEFCEFDRHRN